MKARSPLKRTRIKAKRTTPRKGRLNAKGMKDLREAAWKRDQPLCQLCGCYILEFELDHIIARGVGGKDELLNVRCLCRPCHRQRHGTVQLRWLQ